MDFAALHKFSRYLLLAGLLLFAQRVVQHHELSHALHDVAVAEHGDKGAPPLDHSSEQCIAYLAAGAAAANASCSPAVAETPSERPPAEPSFHHPAPRIVFDSRAPPFSAC